MSERVSKLLEAGDFPTAPPTPPEGGARAGSGISMHQVIASGSELGDLGDLGAAVHPAFIPIVTSLPLYAPNPQPCAPNLQPHRLW